MFSAVVLCAALPTGVAGSHSFVATVKEHKTMYELRQQFSFSLVSVAAPIDEISVTFDDHEDGSADLTISPKLLELSYQLIDSRPVAARTPLVIDTRGGSTIVQPTLVTAHYSIYTLSQTMVHFSKPGAAQSVQPIDPFTRTDVAMDEFSIRVAPKTVKEVTTLKVRLAFASSTPASLIQRSNIYSYDIVKPDVYDRKIPITLKIKYTGDDTDAKSAYRYDVGDGKWEKLASYNNVEERFVEIHLNQASSTVALFSDTASDDGIASWYRYNGCLCAASRHYPKGTLLKVTRLKTQKSIVVRINDYGPEEYTGRIIDLDATAFKKLGSLGAGVIYVNVEPVNP